MTIVAQPLNLRTDVRMTDREIDIATGVSRWRRRSRNPALLNDLVAIVQLLSGAGVLYPEEIGRFLRGRCADLSYAQPIVLLRRGRYLEVQGAAERLIRRMEGGMRGETFEDEASDLLGNASYPGLRIDDSNHSDDVQEGG